MIKGHLRPALFTALFMALTILLVPGCVEVKKKGAEGSSNESSKSGSTGSSSRYGGIYRLPISADPPNLDPAHLTDTTSHIVAGQIFEGLVQFDDELDVAPAIAKRWDVSDDGLTFTFNLKKDVKFHNGRNVKAEDFVYSFTRLLDPATASERAWLFNETKGYAGFQRMIDARNTIKTLMEPAYDTEGCESLGRAVELVLNAGDKKASDYGHQNDPVGAEIHKLLTETGKSNQNLLKAVSDEISESVTVSEARQEEMKSLISSLKAAGAEKLIEKISKLDVQDYIKEGIFAADDYTLVIVLDQPFIPFLSVLAMPNAAVIPKEEVEGREDDFSMNPIGAGPFKFVSWDNDEKIELKVFEDYHEGRAYLDGIEYRIIDDPYTAFMEFEKGNFDSTGNIRIEDSLWPQVSTNPKFDGLIQFHPLLGIYYVGMNVNTPPFHDKRVRQAFNMAVDRESIVRVVRHNRVKIAHGILPPGMPGHASDIKGWAFDPDKAKELLAEAGYPNGEGMPPIEMWYNTNPGHKSVCEVVQQNLAAVGVNIELRNVDWGTYLKKIDNGQAPMFRLGWIADYPDPDNFLYVLLHSSKIGQGNGARFSNPEVDRLLEGARSEANHEKRIEMYQETQRIVVEECPWIPIYYYAEEFIAYDYVKGAKLNAMGPAAMHMKKIYLEK